MRTVKIRPVAEREVMAAYQWYRDRDAFEAAERLLEETEAAIVMLQQFAHSFSVVQRTPGGLELRRLRLRKFPYMVVYFIDAADTVQVIALAHVRKARYWSRRVK